MYCNNQVAMHIDNNHVFHEQTRHIEIYCHFIGDVVMEHRIVTSFVTSSFALSIKLFVVCSKLGMIMSLHWLKGGN